VTLKFNPKTHRYWLDGKPIPGVTTLISGGVPKPQLTYWSARTVAEWVADNEAEVEQLRSMGRGPMVNALKEVPWHKRDTAAVRGTDVHRLAEDLVHGREVEVPEHLADYVEGYVRWLDEWQPVPVLTERPVASRRWWYAGTFDLIADMCGERWLLDIKTASAIYGETALQTDAYRNAEFYLADDDTEQPMPEGISRLGALHVQETGTVLVPLDSSGAAFKDFLHAAWISNATKRIKGYVGEPLHAPPVPDSQTAGAA
jgi:hypothetical protein